MMGRWGHCPDRGGPIRTERKGRDMVRILFLPILFVWASIANAAVKPGENSPDQRLFREPGAGWPRVLG